MALRRSVVIVTNDTIQIRMPFSPNISSVLMPKETACFSRTKMSNGACLPPRFKGFEAMVARLEGAVSEPSIRYQEIGLLSLTLHKNSSPSLPNLSRTKNSQAANHAYPIISNTAPSMHFLSTKTTVTAWRKVRERAAVSRQQITDGFKCSKTREKRLAMHEASGTGTSVIGLCQSTALGNLEPLRPRRGCRDYYSGIGGQADKSSDTDTISRDSGFVVEADQCPGHSVSFGRKSDSEISLHGGNKTSKRTEIARKQDVHFDGSFAIIMDEDGCKSHPNDGDEFNTTVARSPCSNPAYHVVANVSSFGQPPTDLLNLAHRFFSEENSTTYRPRAPIDHPWAESEPDKFKTEGLSSNGSLDCPSPSIRDIMNKNFPSCNPRHSRHIPTTCGDSFISPAVSDSATSRYGGREELVMTCSNSMTATSYEAVNTQVVEIPTSELQPARESQLPMTGPSEVKQQQENNLVYQLLEPNSETDIQVVRKAAEAGTPCVKDSDNRGVPKSALVDTHPPIVVDSQTRQLVSCDLGVPLRDPPLSDKIASCVDKWSMAFPWDTEVVLLNWEVFGNASFKGKQREVINATLSGHDVFVIMPTGGGKSLCFQLPALMADSSEVTVVIVPLLSLVNDQMKQLQALGIECRGFASNSSFEDQSQVYRDLRNPAAAVKFLFVTPEKLSGSKMLLECLFRLQSSGRLGRFVIDEAHCVAQWGKDFRSDYLKLKNLRRDFPRIPLMCLTATATDEIVKDVVTQLRMNNPQIFQSSFSRPNLRYAVLPKNKRSVGVDVVEIIKKYFSESVGIVYCLSRRECECIASQLEDAGIPAAHYHSTTPNRDDTQKKWMNESIRVVVATIAFGMGINKPNVRFVIHTSIPKSIEGFYQESGRAGRDGLPSYCLLLYNFADKLRLEKLFASDKKPHHSSGLTRDQQNVLAVLEFCEEALICRQRLILAHFGEVQEKQLDESRCKVCDNCCRLIETKGVLQFYNANWSAVEAVVKIVREVSGIGQAKHGTSSSASVSQPVFTLSGLRDALLGRKPKAIRTHSISSQLSSFGLFKNMGWSSDAVYALLKRLVIKQILIEELASPLCENSNVLVGHVTIGPLTERRLHELEVDWTPQIHVPLLKTAGALTNFMNGLQYNVSGGVAPPVSGPSQSQRKSRLISSSQPEFELVSNDGLNSYTDASAVSLLDADDEMARTDEENCSRIFNGVQLSGRRSARGAATTNTEWRKRRCRRIEPTTTATSARPASRRRAASRGVPRGSRAGKSSRSFQAPLKTPILSDDSDLEVELHAVDDYQQDNQQLSSLAVHDTLLWQHSHDCSSKISEKSPQTQHNPSHENVCQAYTSDVFTSDFSAVPEESLAFEYDIVDP